jgi:hypothetical protein
MQLQSKDKITILGLPFEASTRQEIDGLITCGVFQFKQYNLAKHASVHIFNSRIVNEIKGKATNCPFKKSRLVIQGYNDIGKEVILTQSLTIQ